MFHSCKFQANVALQPLLVVTKEGVCVPFSLVAILLELSSIGKGASCLLQRKQAVFSSLNLINVAKHALDFFLKSSLFSKHGFRSSYASAVVLISKVVLKEGFNLTKGFSLQVGRSLQAQAFLYRELLFVKVHIEFYLEQEYFEFLLISRVGVRQLNTQSLPKFRHYRQHFGHLFILRLRLLGQSWRSRGFPFQTNNRHVALYMSWYLVEAVLKV